MIRINLLPVKQAAQAERQRHEITRAGLALALLLVLGVAIRIQQGRELAATDARIVQIEDALKALDSQVRDVNDLDAKKKALDSKLKVIADLGRKRVGPVGVMSDLAKAAPDRVWLTDFSEAGGGATITGQAVDNQIVAEFLRNLSGSPYFTNVDLVETTQDQVGDVKLRKFIVKAQINYAAAAGEKKAEAPEGKPRA
ncbi:MAG TPA: PilN domain-containing protein [Candidatus Binatia bacterium]|nr:PilN domain-containing protein [Candidatus Binatia bacterium]